MAMVIFSVPADVDYQMPTQWTQMLHSWYWKVFNQAFVAISSVSVQEKSVTSCSLESVLRTANIFKNVSDKGQRRIFKGQDCDALVHSWM